MFGIEKYLITLNIAVCVFTSLILGIFIYDLNTKNVKLSDQHYTSIIDSSQAISTNQKNLNSEFVSLQNKLNTFQNILSANHSVTLKNNDDFNAKLNEVNNNVNLINDKFRKLPRPVVCQFLN